MKKTKVILMLICVILCMNACKKTQKKETELTQNPPVVSQEETKKPDNTQKKEETDKKEPKVQNETDSSSEETIKQTGLFLGLDGSNFAVIIVNDGEGSPKQLNLQLAKDVDIDKTDVEIGDSVNIEYTVDKTDNKILKKISKAQ